MLLFDNLWARVNAMTTSFGSYVSGVQLLTPRHLWYGWTEKIGRLVDMQLNIAARLAGAIVTTPDFFKIRAKYHTQDDGEKKVGYMTNLISLMEHNSLKMALSSNGRRFHFYIT